MNKDNLSRIVFIILLFIMLGYDPSLYAQVKIGDNPKSINPDAMLEIESGNKGVLLPRIALKSTSSPSPLKMFSIGMILYNTSTINDLTPGLYYCDGKSWIRANTGIVPSDSTSNQNVLWSLKGNDKVTASSFLGSINNAALIMKTNGTERMRITEKGWVGIGTETPKAALQVKGQLIIDSLETGNVATDNILLANTNNGRVKMASASSFITGIQNQQVMVATNGQSIFQTPATITDINKIFLYRNGVLISFTANNSNSIIAEISCNKGDQIRIIQLL